MNLGILHLSDFHLKETSGTAVLSRVPKISAAIRTRCTDMAALLLILSGDISFSGKDSQFAFAKMFFDGLLQALRSEIGIPILGPVIVPGNHDCNFSKESDVRPLLSKALRQEVQELEPGGEKVRQMVSVHEDFFAFERSYSNCLREGSSRLYYSYQFQFDNRLILVHCFNTAWVSQLVEKQGEILFPPKVIPLMIDQRPLLSISVFHHPYPWFDPTNRRAFQRLVERVSDIVLTGHEHDGDNFIRTSSGGAQVAYIEGAAFESEDSETGFNLISLLLKDRRCETYAFTKDGPLYRPAPVVSREFLKNATLIGGHFQNSAAFEKKLTQFDAPFSHPDKGDLAIEDIFVYPDLKIQGLLEKKSKVVQGEHVTEFVLQAKRVSVAGAPLSGKTSLAKKLYSDLSDQHKLVPILVSGDDISGGIPSAIAKLRNQAFRQQYSPDQLEQYIQLDPNRKALIVDDWHLARLNEAGRIAFLTSACKEFGLVLTFGTEQSWFQEVLKAGSESQVSGFHCCDLREFGHRLRERLISKWHDLGDTFGQDEADVTHRIAQSANLLNGVVGKGLFPAFPFFILHTLQVSHGQRENVVTHGSYGHVYEAFLTMRLAGVSKKATDIGTKYTYLSLIAHALFEKDKSALSFAEFTDVHSRFEKEYGIPKDRDEILSQLENARILVRTGDDVGFLHKYCYCYFVAKYFQKTLGDNPDDEHTRLTLKRMAEMVHDDDYMNILIFYIYLTEDRQLIEFFIQRAQTFYAECSLSELQQDVEFVADLVKPRTLELDSSNVRQNRESFAAQKDRATPDSDEDGSRAIRTRYDKALDDSLKLDFAFHALHVMGQVLRNFPGDLKADLKCQLAEESYRLGLRTMSGFLKLLENNLESIRGTIENLVLQHRPKAEEEAASVEAGKILAHLVEAGIFSMIKRVSFSVGLEELRETYLAVRKKFGESHLPARLIDLSIQLDHFAKMPMADIEDLRDATSSLVVPYNILLMLVLEHLYLFPVEYKDRQRLSGLLKFDSKHGLLSDKKFISNRKSH
jgi:hypothetical protein